MRNTLVSVILAVVLTACASFQTKPGQKPPRILPREPVYETSGVSMSMLWVSVRIDDGQGKGWCFLPDASNTIDCQFTYGGLETSSWSVSYEGYRSLSPQGARLICGEALWSVGALHTPAVTDACARRLLEHRWLDDADHFDDPEAAYRQP